MLRIGSDFSGVGAFNQALIRLGVEYKEVFACDMDKFARDTFIHNYGEPEYYPTNVYDREIPSESLDIYMTSPPCQAFSLAGKRLGKEDKRGILFFNSHEFIQVNKPRFFIFENVKGLLSDDGGRTFQEWVNMLGGKSVNGVPVLFPYDDSVPYHLYWQVLNAKHHGVPQNRERVFLIGIRDDADNRFQFPREEHLTKRLKDVLEDEVDEKYFLSEKMLGYLENRSDNFNNGKINYRTENDYATAITKSSGSIDISDNIIKVKSATSNGYEEAREDIWIADYRADEGLRIRKDDISPCMTSSMRDSQEWSPKAGTRNPPLVGYNDKRLNQTIAKNELPNGKPMMLDTYNQSIHEECPTLKARHAQNNDRKLWDGYKIRRLTPRECFRLMDFPDTFTWIVSDSQAYKQAGNSIVVNVLYKILKQLPI
jgi:DNA (cytosine-5)-methyltransferase 1